MTQAHDPYSALRYRDYRCLLAGSVLASIGGEALAVAVGWELYERTNSKAVLGLTGLAQFLPVLLLALPAGQAVDRYNRKLLLQLAQVTIALAALGLAALSWFSGPVWVIFVCLALIGCGRSVSMPARSSLVPHVVPMEMIGNAVTWNSSGFQVANVAGPAVGGVVIGFTGRAVGAYLLTAGCCLACVCLLIPIRPRTSFPNTTARSLASLLAGVRFVWQSELLLAAITLDLFAVLLGGATALLPVFAKDILHVGPAGLGWLRAAPAIGAFVMAFVLAHRPPLRRAGRALVWAVLGFGAATVGFGLSRDFHLSFVLLVVTGALDNISVVVRATLMQVLTPDEMRGRVAAVNTVFISSSNELGTAESGYTAEWFGDLAPQLGYAAEWGPIASVVFGGIGTGIVVLVVVSLWPALYWLGPLQPPVEATRVTT
jgi:MFS family permease